MAERVHWRVGRRVPTNVYHNDEIVGRFQCEALAHQAVEALNRLEMQRAAQRAEHAERADAYAERYGTAKR